MSCGPVVVDGNVALAFGLVTAAGLSTTLGAFAAFIMPYSTGEKNLFLAASLAVAAGVMLYVSFVEIFAAKAVEDFTACVDRRFAYLYATLCFFGGVALTYVFDVGMQAVERCVGAHRERKKRAKQSGTPSRSDGDVTPPQGTRVTEVTRSPDVEGQVPSFVEVSQMRLEAGVEGDNDPLPSQEAQDTSMQIHHQVGHDGHMVANIYQNYAHDSKALIRMGIFAGLALAFHNFPEGLATFVAVLEDPSVGASVAIAIGIHNIPEGICVAMPIYYATGSRKKAFFWATLSGMTELVGALLGWAVLRKVFTRVVYGVLFGIVAGMMVYISLKELLPTAHRYDPEDKVTTFGLIFGMVIMAASLVLFEF